MWLDGGEHRRRTHSRSSTDKLPKSLLACCIFRGRKTGTTRPTGITLFSITFSSCHLSSYPHKPWYSHMLDCQQVICFGLRALRFLRLMLRQEASRHAIGELCLFNFINGESTLARLTISRQKYVALVTCICPGFTQLNGNSFGPEVLPTESAPTYSHTRKLTYIYTSNQIRHRRISWRAWILNISRLVLTHLYHLNREPRNRVNRLYLTFFNLYKCIPWAPFYSATPKKLEANVILIVNDEWSSRS